MHKINLTVAQNKILSKAGITCAEQLIRQIPNRYNDCRNIYSIGPNVINQTISVIGIMTKITSKTTTKLPMCISSQMYLFQLCGLINHLCKKNINSVLDSHFLFTENCNMILRLDIRL